MENRNENETFLFTYSAKEQEELRRIREKYQSPEENKLEQLRRLDRSVTKPGTSAAIVLGTISSLILGVGMCCCMVWGDRLFIPGIFIGIAGIIGVSLAYPLYSHITRKQREKLAPEILRLTDELMK